MFPLSSGSVSPERVLVPVCGLINYVKELQQDCYIYVARVITQLHTCKHEDCTSVWNVSIHLCVQRVWKTRKHNTTARKDLKFLTIYELSMELKIHVFRHTKFCYWANIVPSTVQVKQCTVDLNCSNDTCSRQDISPKLPESTYNDIWRHFDVHGTVHR